MLAMGVEEIKQEWMAVDKAFEFFSCEYDL